MEGMSFSVGSGRVGRSGLSPTAAAPQLKAAKTSTQGGNMNRGVLSTLGAVTALCLASALLAGCGGGDGAGDQTANSAAPKSGGTITIGQNGEVETLDPTVALTAPSINVLSQIMEPLYKPDARGDTEPWLVSSAHESADELVYTYQLRPGIKFSDGSPMKAKDAAFSIEAARKSSNWESLFEQFEKVQATGPLTLQITTKQPVAAMEAILSLYATAVVPSDYGGVSEKEFAQNPIGTGPFTLGPWKHGESLTLLKNPHYWRPDEPHLDSAVIRTVSDPGSRVSQLSGGDLDVAEEVPYAEVAGLENTSATDVQLTVPTQASYLTLNERAPQFTDPRVREAVNLALDRKGILKAAFNGHGELGGSFLPLSVPMHDSSITPPARDVSKAKQLMTEAIEGGLNPNVTLLVVAGITAQTLTSQIVQQDLEEIGFNVKIETLAEAAELQKWFAGEFALTIAGYYPNVLDPSEGVSLYLATEGLFTGVDTSRSSELAAEGVTESDAAKRERIYHEIQQEVASQECLLTLNYIPKVWATQSDVTRFRVNPLDMYWLAETGLAG